MASRWRRDFPVAASEDSYVTRREFTKFLGLTSVAFLIGTFATAGRKLFHRLLPASDAIPVVAVDEIPVGGYKLFRHSDENSPGILLRLASDRFVAYDQRCTHLSCPVIFDAETRRLECPCHKGFFGVEDGRVLAGPPRRPLTQLTVFTRNAQVWVETRQEGAV